MSKAVVSCIANGVLPLTLLFSPFAHVLLGNALGRYGALFLPAMIVVAFVQRITIKAYCKVLQIKKDETEIITLLLGKWAAYCFVISGRMMFFFCASTLLLATAGFVFNEIFLYWFPNFAFAFLLLIAIVVVQLCGSTYMITLQTLAIGLSLFSLILLTAAGMTSGNIFYGDSHIDVTHWRAYFLPFFVFLGIEIFIFSPLVPSSVTTGREAITGLVLALVVLLLWGGIMLEFVPREKLADSFNPHTIAARNILGQKGRIIIGVCIISSVVAAVNGLLCSVTKQVLDIARSGLQNNRLVKNTIAHRFILIMMASVPAVLMALGSAGSEELEIYIRAAMLYWLIAYSALNISVFQLGGSGALKYLCAGLIIFCAVLVLLMTDPSPQKIFPCFVVLGLLGGGISILLCLFNRGPNYKEKMKHVTKSI